MSDLELDVRPILRDGGDPFSAIMGAVARLSQGQRLRLYAPFKPSPLFDVMTNRGFACDASPLPQGDWLVIFTPAAEVGSRAAESVAEAPETWPDPAYYLDCSSLAQRAPMERILARLDGMSEGTVLFALLTGEPIALFAELAARGHAWVGEVDDTGQAYRMLIRAGHRG